MNLVKVQKKEEVKIKAEKSVNNIILDVLIPPINKVQSNINLSLEKKLPNEDKEINEKTREKFKTKIKNGELDDRKIDIIIQKQNNSGIGMISGGMMDESSMINLQDMIGNMMPKRNKKRKVTIGEAKKILLESEMSKLIDMDEVKDEAIQRAENTGIIFIDEIDKISGGSKKGGGPDVSREGVQRDLLPIVEGTSVTTKYGVMKTDHVLFIAAGAFHLSKPSDLIPELQGRFPIRVELDNLTQDDFLKILNEPKNSLTKQYTALIKSENVEIIFNEDALKEISEKAFIINSEIENIGARRLHTVMSKLLNEILFDIPEKIGPNAKIIITKNMVEEKLNAITQNKDLSEYIL
jgi:ATP-dependent HslUV protease ATP-binding subunit HslU